MQKRLAPRIERRDRLGEVRHIAGVDIGFEDEGATTRAVIVVMTYPELDIVDQVLHREPTRMPYIPGLLSFRELPAALEAYRQLKIEPELIMVDGMGIAHPRRLGIAAHLGLWLDKPTIGVGKSRLCGKHDEAPPTKGDWTPLRDRVRAEDPLDSRAVSEVTIGAVLRTREKIKPLYISTGHRVGLDTAVDWVMRCVTRYKLPEPTRQADRIASRRGQLRDRQGRDRQEGLFVNETDGSPDGDSP
ncbi:deoxyribonuclease V [Halomonas shantousis]